MIYEKLAKFNTEIRLINSQFDDIYDKISIRSNDSQNLVKSDLKNANKPPDQKPKPNDDGPCIDGEDSMLLLIDNIDVPRSRDKALEESKLLASHMDIADRK